MTEIPQATQDVKRYRSVRLSSESPDMDWEGAREEEGVYPGMNFDLRDS